MEFIKGSKTYNESRQSGGWEGLGGGADTEMRPEGQSGEKAGGEEKCKASRHKRRRPRTNTKTFHKVLFESSESLRRHHLKRNAARLHN